MNLLVLLAAFAAAYLLYHNTGRKPDGPTDVMMREFIGICKDLIRSDLTRSDLKWLQARLLDFQSTFRGCQEFEDYKKELFTQYQIVCDMLGAEGVELSHTMSVDAKTGFHQAA